jgi:hypothetical protein
MLPSREQVVSVAALLYPSIRATGHATAVAVEESLDVAELMFARFDAREIDRAAKAEMAASIVPARRMPSPRAYEPGETTPSHG